VVGRESPPNLAPPNSPNPQGQMTTGFFFFLRSGHPSLVLLQGNPPPGVHFFLPVTGAIYHDPSVLGSGSQTFLFPLIDLPVRLFLKNVSEACLFKRCPILFLLLLPICLLSSPPTFKIPPRPKIFFLVFFVHVFLPPFFSPFFFSELCS